MNKSGGLGLGLHQAASSSPPLARVGRSEAVFWPGCALMGLGPELLERFEAHAREMGVERRNGRVLNILPMGTEFSLAVGSAVEQARAVVRAPGVGPAGERPRRGGAGRGGAPQAKRGRPGRGAAGRAGPPRWPRTAFCTAADGC